MRWTAFLVAVLVVLAGCSTAGSVFSGGEEATATVADDGRVVSYANLTGAQQAAFRAAVDDRAVFVPRSTAYLNGSHLYTQEQRGPLDGGSVVRYGGHRYGLNQTRGVVGFSTYFLEASPARDAGGNATALATLPERVRDEVRAAIAEGEHATAPGEWSSLPRSLSGDDYVRYENRTYRLTVGVGRGMGIVIRAER